jgi:hypothetical protein
MANRPITGGVQSYVLWKAETTFNSAETPDAHFGLDTNFEHNFKNNMKLNRGFKGSATSGRDAQKFTSGKAEMELNLDFDLNDESFLEMVLGDKTGSVYSGDDFPSSMTIAHAMDNVTTDRAEIYTGCVVNNCAIKGAEGEPVTCNLGLLAAKMTYDSSLTANTAIIDDAPYTFSESTFELPNASAINNIVNDFEVTIENNWTMHYGTSRSATAVTPGARAYRIKLSTKYVDDDLLNKAFGGTSPAEDTPTQNATMEIVLTRPDDDTLTFLFTLAPIESYSLKAALGDPISENVDLVASSLTVTKA